MTSAWPRSRLRDDLHDTYIAATARSQQLPVVTANVDDFERIDGVQVVDWVEF